MGLLKEFKEFAVRGNLVDIAVAFVMGATFGKIVTALTEGIVMPLAGLLMGGFDLSKKEYLVKAGTPEVKDASGAVVQPAVEAVSLKWGAFVTSIVDFIIVAFVVFLIIKAINSMKQKKAEAPPAAPVLSTSEKLLMEIRDGLKVKQIS
jgi:large conductance mechanosensitive channel